MSSTSRQKMGKVYPNINARLQKFLLSQPMFFVASAPLAANGHVNLSPKGLDSFRILDKNTVGYPDLTRSGVETISHVKENGRIALMFCAIEGPPKIVRLHGKDEVIEPSHVEFGGRSKLFPSYGGLRSIIRISCNRVSDSSGFVVPLMTFQGPRKQLAEWAIKKGESELKHYRSQKNESSIDGLLGLTGSSEEDVPCD
ncbi:MAG: pyridoxamine 5'-phosphate oxidase family protein [Planctomycetota bacterium]